MLYAMNVQNRKLICAMCKNFIRCEKMVEEFRVVPMEEKSFECELQGCYKFFSKIDDLHAHISCEHEGVFIPKK